MSIEEQASIILFIDEQLDLMMDAYRKARFDSLRDMIRKDIQRLLYIRERYTGNT